jgi:hypothetical protein
VTLRIVRGVNSVRNVASNYKLYVPLARQLMNLEKITAENVDIFFKNQLPHGSKNLFLQNPPPS